MDERTLIVIPSYNEKGNIERLIVELFNLPHSLDILVVDDDSPDGTGKLVAKIAEEEPRLKIIHREGKGGRGSATLDGFRYGLSQGGKYAYIMEMDADFSHSPTDLPRLVTRVKEYDVVIGSRYLPESRVINWGLARTIFSHLANFYARSILSIPISDYTNGYRIYRREALAALDFDRIEEKGYIVLSETAYQLHLLGFHIDEVPITFVNRQRGESNLTFKEIYSAFFTVLRLWWRYRRFRKRRDEGR
jgi:dolichol-phosphate mannosyltransferase